MCDDDDEYRIFNLFRYISSSSQENIINMFIIVNVEQVERIIKITTAAT